MKKIKKVLLHPRHQWILISASVIIVLILLFSVLRIGEPFNMQSVTLERNGRNTLLANTINSSFKNSEGQVLAATPTQIPPFAGLITPPTWWTVLPNNLRNFLEQLYISVFYFFQTSNLSYLLEGISQPNGPSPTPIIPTATPGQPTGVPTQTPHVQPTLPPSTPPPVQGSGIWISSQEIMALPMSGSAWNSVLSAANGNWGSANLGDNNSDHDIKTLAGALIAIRKNDGAMRNKTIDGLKSAMVSPLSRSLELSRGLQTYIIAADIIGYHDAAFEAWVRKMLNENVSAHTGGSSLCNSSGSPYNCADIGGIICTAERSANNWGGHARASVTAAAIYLNDSQLITNMVNAHKSFIGLSSPNHLYCENTNWHASLTERFGENRVGTTIQGQDVSGVLPEDWRRGTEFTWPPTLSGYMWEGMQGFIVTGVILHRAGLVPFNSGDNAIVRAMNQLYNGINNPPSGDDTWIPWVVNFYGGTNFPTQPASSGKNMGWTDWTLATQ